MKIYNTIGKTTGATPLVRLNRIGEGFDGDLLAKLEFFNPLGSVKDRIAASMIEAGEIQGLITPPDVHRRANERKHGDSPCLHMCGKRLSPLSHNAGNHEH